MATEENRQPEAETSGTTDSGPEKETSSGQSAQEQAAQESAAQEQQDGAVAQEDATAEQLQAQVEDLKAELAQTKEQVLRAHADAQNARRRAEQDVERAHKFGLEKFVNDILPVADNLERSVEAAKSENADLNTVVEGVELTLKSLVDGLRRHKVEQVNPEGEPFDPQLHQAMTMVEQPDVEPNTVVNVFQRGYTLHGRLVRPAMVVVSKAPEGENKASAADQDKAAADQDK